MIIPALSTTLLLLSSLIQEAQQSSLTMPPPTTKPFPLSSNASDLDLPIPRLEIDFRISVQLNPLINVGKGPWGDRNWISFSSGEWKASWGRGTVEV